MHAQRQGAARANNNKTKKGAIRDTPRVSLQGFHHRILCHSLSVLQSSSKNPCLSYKANRKSSRELLLYVAMHACMAYLTNDSHSVTYVL